MSKKNEVLTRQIVEKAGGASNIESITNCATRLRMYIKNPAKFDQEGMKKVKGVLGFQLSGNQYQVIVGANAIHYCKQIQEEFGINAATTSDNTEKDKPKGNLLNRFLETISGCIAPLVPALSAAGFIKVILILLSTAGLISADGATYQLLNTAAGSVFYFMPIILAYTSAKRFHANEILAIVIAGVLLHPDFISLMGSGESLRFLKIIPVTSTSYDSTVVPIILTVFVMSYVEKLIDKYVPELISHLFRPFLIVLIMAPIAFCITGPLGAIIGEGLAVVLEAIFAKAGWLALGLTLSVTAFLLMTGMHLALIPLATASIAAVGYDQFVLVVFLCFTLSQGAAALAVFCKTKNNTLRQIAFPAALSGLLGGISEPAFYGISVRMKKPLIASTIASTVAGLYAGLTHLKVFAFGLYTLLGIPGYYNAQYPSNLRDAVITILITTIGTFVLVWIIGFDDSIYEEDADTNSDAKKSSDNAGAVSEETPALSSEYLGSVASGTVVPMEKINDDTFAGGILGQCVGIISQDGICYAPTDGVVETVFNTKHALGIKSNQGAEVLIHVGIDSVKLEGAGFEVYVKEGDRVKKGQKILKYDKDIFQKNQIDETTVLIVSNSADYSAVETVCDHSEITKGDAILHTIA